VDVVDQRCSPVPGDCVTRTLLCTSHAALWSHADVLTFIQRFRDEFGDRLTHPSAAWLVSTATCAWSHLALTASCQDQHAGLEVVTIFGEKTKKSQELFQKMKPCCALCVVVGVALLAR